MIRLLPHRFLKPVRSDSLNVSDNMKSIEYIVKPYISVGNIEFEKSIEDTIENLGEPIKIIEDEIMRETRVYYPNFVLVFLRNRLKDIRFSDELEMKKLNILLNEVNITKEKDLITRLSEIPKSKPSEIIKKTINFNGLGINITNYESKIKREIRFFAKSRKKYYELYQLA